MDGKLNSQDDGVDRPEMTKQELQLLLEKCFWKFARTLSHNPHHYTLRETWKRDDDFDKAVQAIRDHAVEEKFGKKTYQVCYLGTFKYWTMGAPIDETILINKKQTRFTKV